VTELAPRASEATQAMLAAAAEPFGGEPELTRAWGELRAGLAAHLRDAGIANDEGERA
jgi:hypothetical protein